MLAALKFVEDRRRICDNGKSVATKKPPRQFKNGSAAFQENSFAVEDQPLSLARDRLLLGAMAAAKRLIRRLKIRTRRARNRASVRTGQHSFSFQLCKITPDGGGSDTQNPY